MSRRAGPSATACLALSLACSMESSEEQPGGGETDETGASGDDVETGGDPEWGEPIDCEYHRPAGPSSLTIVGTLDQDPVDLGCGFGGEDDLINWCPEGSLGLNLQCTTEGGYEVALSVVPPLQGSWEDPHGDPRYSLDIRRDESSWSGSLQNATEHRLEIDDIDDENRRIRGSFTAAWYPLTVQGLQFPAGSVTGNFDLSF